MLQQRQFSFQIPFQQNVAYAQATSSVQSSGTHGQQTFTQFKDYWSKEHLRETFAKFEKNPEYQKIAEHIKNKPELLLEPLRSVDIPRPTNTDDFQTVINSKLMSWADGYYHLSVKESNATMKLVISNSLGFNFIDLDFSRSGDSWRTNTNLGLEFVIPTQASMDFITVFSLMLLIIRLETAKQSAKVIVAKSSKSSENTQNHCSEENGVFKASHDFKCTIPKELFWVLVTWGISIPKDGQATILLGTLGVQEVDVFDCCVEHDAKLWCSKSRYPRKDKYGNIIDPTEQTAHSADIDVISCFMGKFLDASTRGNVFEDIINIAFFAWYLPLAALLYAGTVVSPGEHDASLLNLDGRNDESCLCGGNKPTVSCEEPCRNLCKELERRVGKTNTEKCDNDCKVPCEYDSFGRLKKNVRLVSNRGIPCCPEKSIGCLGSLSNNHCKPKNCSDWYWKCIPCVYDWKRDPNCSRDGFKARYGPHDAGINDDKEKCPERPTPNGPGSQPYYPELVCGDRRPIDVSNEGTRPNS